MIEAEMCYPTFHIIFYIRIVDRARLLTGIQTSIFYDCCWTVVLWQVSFHETACRGLHRSGGQERLLVLHGVAERL